MGENRYVEVHLLSGNNSKKIIFYLPVRNRHKNEREKLGQTFTILKYFIELKVSIIID